MSSLKKQAVIFCSMVAASFFLSLNTYATNPHPSFAGAEHIRIGDEIKLFFSSSDTGQTGTLLHLPNGLTLSYGDIIALGDLYEIPGKPVSQGQSYEENRKRFLDAFNSFAQNPDALNEARKIIDVMHSEKQAIDEGIEHGQTSEETYQQITGDIDRQLNCITGGGCSKKTWWLKSGRYLKLAKNNYDHFGFNAWITYKTGHDLAIEEAIAAYQTHDLSRLEKAYAMNAFACHFLSDRFSAGHIRTPREELAAQVTPSSIAPLLARFMHDEESKYGIHVHNRRGNQWIAFGDDTYIEEKNAGNRNIIRETLQVSANQIFAAYLQGMTTNNDDSYVYDFIPEADETGNASNQDISPLFYWDVATQQLMRRDDVKNIYDKHWTASWWGLSTAILLSKENKLSTEFQAELALSAAGEKAMQAGLITDKNILEYMTSRS